MRKEPNKKMIGLFMVCGLGFLAAVLGIYLKDKLFPETGNMVVMYFEESINGLNVGSSVVFKGVEIGKVAKIDLIADAHDLNFSIPVYAKMSQGINSRQTDEDKREVLDALIGRGLRARLTTQSYLTGQLMIELEMLPDTKITLRNREDAPGILEIPTVLSPLGEISKGMQDLPIRQSVEKFNQFFDALNKEMPQIREIVANTNKIMKANSSASGDLAVNLNRAINNVSEAAKSMRNLTDYLERHPEALLKGKRGY